MPHFEKWHGDVRDKERQEFLVAAGIPVHIAWEVVAAEVQTHWPSNYSETVEPVDALTRLADWLIANPNRKGLDRF